MTNTEREDMLHKAIPLRLKNYVISHLLGKGTQAVVYSGYELFTNKPVAIKMYSEFSELAKSEIEILNSIKSKHLKDSLRLIEVVHNGENFCLVTQLSQGKELFRIVKESNGVLEGYAKGIFRSLLLAVQELHQAGFCHLDLKLENIMYDRKTGRTTLLDFGYASTIFDPSNPIEETLQTKFCGSIHYTCPEIGRNQPYFGTQSDIWSLGVLLFTMIAARFPFNSNSTHNRNNKILLKIQRGNITWPSWFSGQLVNLIKKMLQFHGSDRATIAELLSHPWFLAN